MKHLILTLCLLLFASTAFAQEVQAPVEPIHDLDMYMLILENTGKDIVLFHPFPLLASNIVDQEKVGLQISLRSAQRTTTTLSIITAIEFTIVLAGIAARMF